MMYSWWWDGMSGGVCPGLVLIPVDTCYSVLSAGLVITRITSSKVTTSHTVSWQTRKKHSDDDDDDDEQEQKMKQLVSVNHVIQILKTSDSSGPTFCL